MPADDCSGTIRVIRDQGICADTYKVLHVFFGVYGPVLHGEIVGMSIVDDFDKAQIDAKARPGVIERQLEHII